MSPSPLLATILLAIDQADTLPILGQWWSFHQHQLRRLTPPELAVAVAHKDRRKQLLHPPITPPAATGIQRRLI